MKNLEHMLDIIDRFSKIKMKIGFGFEFEFYILNEKNELIDQNIFIPFIQNFLIQNKFPALVVKESEFGQIEIISIISFDLISKISLWHDLLNKLKSLFKLKNFSLEYTSKPFLNKAGNGLHINISLHDPETLENLFGCKDFTAYDCFDLDFYHLDINNSLLAYSIGGVLNGVKNNVSNYLCNSSILKRIENPDINTPCNISWGYNNRTTLVRIPEGLPNTKRLENRLPSSENDLLNTTVIVLNDIYDGIFNKFTPQRCTFGLAFDEQYKLDKLI